MKILYWIFGILFVIILVIVGLYFYYIYVPPSAKNLVVTIPPAPVPGPDDAYLNYQKMLALYPGTPKEPDFQRLLDLNNQLTVQDIPVLHRLMDKYQPCLDEMEQGSQKKVCTIPIPPLPNGKFTYAIVSTYTMNSTGFDTHSFLTLQILAKIMVLKGKLAELENRPQDAIQEYAMIIRMGKQLDQTTLIMRLISAAMRAVGVNAMGELLDNPHSVSYASDIYNTMKQFEPAQSIDTAVLANYEPGLRMNDVIDIPRVYRMLFERIAKPNIEAALIRNKIANAKQEMVYLASATRVYQAQHQKEPDKLENLVPDLMVSVPKDPFSNLTFEYLNRGGEVTFYSFGPDTTDNQARLFYDPTNGTVSNGDVVVRLKVH